MKPCQKSYNCVWGRKEENKVVCTLGKCVIKETAKGKYEDTLLPKMMKEDPKNRTRR